ncbi:MAG: hypothetical protein WCG75_12955, partial [Armatimonadota bacterium]
MSLDPEDLRRLVPQARKNERFMSNAGKSDRERELLECWCALTGRAVGAPVKGEGPDFMMGDTGIEMVEVLDRGRRRHGEYKDEVKSLEAGVMPKPSDGGDLQDALEHAADWVANTIIEKANHYGLSAAKWVLVVYADYSYWQRTDWSRVRSIVAAKVRTFARIDV